jgi:hypothetical protein
MMPGVGNVSPVEGIKASASLRILAYFVSRMARQSELSFFFQHRIPWNQCFLIVPSDSASQILFGGGVAPAPFPSITNEKLPWLHVRPLDLLSSIEFHIP